MHEDILLNLPQVARQLGLPIKWIKNEADAGRIPHLRIGKKYRFTRWAVESAIAAQMPGGEYVPRATELEPWGYSGSTYAN